MSAFILVDAAIRDDIRTSLDTSLCVEAGAGTGKTTVLVARIVELLKRGPYGVDDIAVMTFTEPAAAELASRVREGVERAHRDAVGEERVRLEAALLGLYRAQISTIHSFSTNILRERPVEAGLDPQFTVLDELAARLSFDRAYETWLAQLLAEDRAEITTALHRGMELKDIRTATKALHRHRYVLPLAPAQGAAGSAVDDLLGWLQLELPRLIADSHACTDESDRAFVNVQTVADFAEELGRLREDALELERAILFRAPWYSPSGGQKGNWPGVNLKELKDTLKEFKEAVLPAAQDQLRGEALAALMPIIEQFVSDYAVKRRAEGTAEYDDLLLWARDLVRDNDEVRGYFHKRYPRLLVDEFQDTDPIQAELIMRIAALDGSGEDWRALVPGPGHLFVVGDPKQSIYRFRRADIAMYDAVKGGPLATGVRQLVQNFRSVEGVLGWVNGIFDRLFEEKLGVQPANVRLQARPIDPPMARASVVVVHGEEDVETADEVRTEEARVLAAALSRAVRDQPWSVRDRRNGKIRPACWRDIAILMPARTSATIYTDALEAQGIPFRMEGNSDFYRRQEIRDLIACLHAIDDPNDRISLVASLRSGACGCSDEELFLWHAAGNALDLRVPVAEDAHGAVADGLRLLAGLRRERRGLSLSELVRRTLERTHLVELALTEPGGEQAAANLLKLADQAREFAGAGGGGLRPFTHWLAERRDERTDEQEAGIYEDSSDVVRLVTIHKAKGLEWPIVALANINVDRKTDSGPVPDAAGHQLHLRCGPEKARFTTPGWEDARDREAVMSDAERRRLLYVATTRARDHLIVPLVPAVGQRIGMLGWIEAELPEWSDQGAGTDVGGCFILDRPAANGTDREDSAAASEASPDALASLKVARDAWRIAALETRAQGSVELSVVTATSVERLWQRPLTVEVTEADGTVVATGKGPPLPLGDAVHRVMEVADLAGGDGLERIVSAVCAEWGLADREAEVADLCRRCVESPVIARATASGELWREVPFTVPWEGGIATGRMDLVFVEAGAVVVVDYKTDTLGVGGATAAVEGHRGQAEIYAAAAEIATGMKVAQIVFVFARAGSEAAVFELDVV